MKKLIGLIVLTLLPAAFIAASFEGGCGPSNTTNPGGGPTATPAPYSTPQTVPMAMVVLNSAANYAVLSYSGITNTGATTICGSLGTYPSASVDGGIIVNCGGTRQVATGAANTAETDLGTAYTDAMGRSGGAILPPGGDIGGQTLYPGLYSEVGNLNVSSSNLTLDAKGDPNAVFIFQVHGNLIVGPARQVILANSAAASNVFWAVTGYGALNTTVHFAGNIMAHTAVTLNTGARLEGRALASTQNVTFLANTISFP